MRKDIFKKVEKDLTIAANYTIKKSIINKVKSDAEKNNLSVSKVISMILENYYEEQ